MVTDKDIQRIRTALKPDFKNMEKSMDQKLTRLETNIKQYISVHPGGSHLN